MEKFMSFVIGTIIIFYILGFVGKILLKLFLRRKFGQFEPNGSNGGAFFGGNGQNFGDNNDYSQNNRQNTAHREGEVFISQNRSTEKRVKDKVGDYVDFEEIKNN